jgi:putative two-component system response regulator
MNSLPQQQMQPADSTFYDSLTGLYSRDLFMLILDREIKLSQRNGNTFTFILIDIDDSSLSALKKIGSTILETLRRVDVAARYEDNTVALILAEANECSLRQPLDRLFEQIQDSAGQTVAFSAGVVVCPDDAHSLESVLAKACEALDQAKKLEQNSYIVAGGKPEVKKDNPAILIVDDEPLNIKLLQAILMADGFRITTASSGEEALQIIDRLEIDLVLLDITMPGMDGYEVCRIIKEYEHTRLIPVVMVTALDDTGAKVKAMEAGADDFLTKPPQTVELLTRVRSLVRIKTLNENLSSIEHILFSFANAVESKDRYTRGHVSRVAELADRLAKRLNRSQQERRSIRIGSMLHDLGKISIEENILNKKGPLESGEQTIMHRHPVIGEEIAMPLRKSLGISLDIIRHHHEKLDGSGYPDGLAGDQVSIPVRIMTVVDIYDALSIDRSFRSAMPADHIFAVLQEEADQGRLDRGIVAEFIAMIREQNQPLSCGK